MTKRAAAPDLLDLCECGCEYGVHQGRGACTQCGKCRRFAAAKADASPPPAPRRVESARRAALYLRVSTREQTVDNQRPELEQLAAARGFEVVRVYEEQASAAGVRPQYQAMLADAHRGRFHVILVWAIDRFGRSMSGNLQAVLELDRRGVQVVSFRETWLDTGGPVRALLVAIFSWVAEQERAQLVARTKTGLERAKRSGKRLGRPPAIINLSYARALRGRGKTLRWIAVELGVPLSVVARALRRTEGEP